MDLLCWPISDASDRHTGHVQYARSAALTRVPRYKPSWINSKLWAMLLYHQCSILTEGISNPCSNHLDRMRSGIRVPWESEWRCDWRSKSQSLRSWCKSPPIQSPSLPFHGGNTKSPMIVEERRLGWLEGGENNLAEGVAVGLKPCSYRTRPVAYRTRSAYAGWPKLFQKMFSLFQSLFLLFLNPKTCMSLIQIRCKYFSYPNAMYISSLFPMIWHIEILITWERYCET